MDIFGVLMVHSCDEGVNQVELYVLADEGLSTLGDLGTGTKGVGRNLRIIEWVFRVCR